MHRFGIPMWMPLEACRFSLWGQRVGLSQPALDYLSSMGRRWSTSVFPPSPSLLHISSVLMQGQFPLLLQCRHYEAHGEAAHSSLSEELYPRHPSQLNAGCCELWLRPIMWRVEPGLGVLRVESRQDVGGMRKGQRGSEMQNCRGGWQPAGNSRQDRLSSLQGSQGQVQLCLVLCSFWIIAANMKHFTWIYVHLRLPWWLKR